jgi:hypothetical protein
MYQGTIIIKILEKSCVQDCMPCNDTVKIQYCNPKENRKSKSLLMEIDYLKFTNETR